MSTYFLAAPLATGPPTPPRPTEPPPRLVLESFDGQRQIPLDGSTGWKAQAGATGLGMPPIEVVRSVIPGVHGSVQQEVRVGEREVILPLLLTASDRTLITHQAMVSELVSLLDPLTGQFRIVSTTPLGERQLTVSYTGGLEGAFGRDSYSRWWRKIVLTAVGCQPFAEARKPRSVEFQMSGGGGVFLGVAGGTDAPWGTRALSSSAVIGDSMRVQVTSEVPVHPVLELVGSMDSFTGTMALEDTALPPYFGGQKWSVSVPSGVASGESFRIVTDPRGTSIRANGQRAAGRVALGSSLTPFFPGGNVLSVAAPGGTADTRVRLSWTELFWMLR